MLLRQRRELREKVIASVEALQGLVDDLKEGLARRQQELAARAAEVDQAAGALAERQRTLDELAGAMERQQVEVRQLLAEVKAERDALQARSQALAEREAGWRLRTAPAPGPRVVNQAVLPSSGAPTAEAPAPVAGARAGSDLPVAAGGEEKPAAPPPAAEPIMVRIIGPAGEIQLVPAQVRFGEGAL